MFADDIAYLGWAAAAGELAVAPRSAAVASKHPLRIAVTESRLQVHARRQIAQTAHMRLGILRFVGDKGLQEDRRLQGQQGVKSTCSVQLKQPSLLQGGVTSWQGHCDVENHWNSVRTCLRFSNAIVRQ